MRLVGLSGSLRAGSYNSALLPTVAVARDLHDGRLVDLLPDWRPKKWIVHAVFPSRRGLLPSVRMLLDFLAEGCAEQQAHGEAARRAAQTDG